ncbi:putative membrane protein [Escherichia coli 1-392-07_S4_C1]|nr:putative membrane protein [Escherichia coli 1-392-07_S4_C1]
MLINLVILPFCDLCYISGLYKMYLLIYINIRNVVLSDI